MQTYIAGTVIFVVLGLGVVGIADAVRRIRRVKKAEKLMVDLLRVEYDKTKLEVYCNELEDLYKKVQQSPKYEKRLALFKIENELNLKCAKLDDQSIELLKQGLQQSSEHARIDYILKILNESVVSYEGNNEPAGQ
jgi:hypothetical protein